MRRLHSSVCNILCVSLVVVIVTIVLPGSTATASSNWHTDPPAVVTSSTSELTILRKELYGYPNYGTVDARADVLYSSENDDWHFDLSLISLPGTVHGAEVRLGLVLDDHYGIPLSEYVGRVLANGTVIFSGGYFLDLGVDHGAPFGQVFTNWRVVSFQIDDLLPTVYTISIENNSSLDSGHWIAIDYIELHLYTGMTVPIDIKPGSDPNCFNINGHGVVPVAILGGEDLDVTQIDFESLLFAGMEVRVRGNRGPLCAYEYSNDDVFLDLVCHFEDNPAVWTPGEGEACVEGNLLENFDGTPIEGCDSICIVP